jgi:hypothetical protein
LDAALLSLAPDEISGSKVTTGQSFPGLPFSKA